jgi:hypothetical protein
MRLIIYIAAWLLIGLWSFILTQNHIKGWNYVRFRPNPHRMFISAMLLGPITTLTCFYTIYVYHKIKHFSHTTNGYGMTEMI